MAVRKFKAGVSPQVQDERGDDVTENQTPDGKKWKLNMIFLRIKRFNEKLFAEKMVRSISHKKKKRHVFSILEKKNFLMMKITGRIIFKTMFRCPHDTIIRSKYNI